MLGCWHEPPGPQAAPGSDAAASPATSITASALQRETTFRMAGPPGYASAHPYVALMAPRAAAAATAAAAVPAPAPSPVAHTPMPHVFAFGDAPLLPLLLSPPPVPPPTPPPPPPPPPQQQQQQRGRAAPPTVSGLSSTSSHATAAKGTAAPVLGAAPLPFGVAALLSDPGSLREARSPLARTETWTAAELAGRRV